MMNNPRTASNTYDKGIMPAETNARLEREQENYKQIPDSSDQNADSIDTTAGYPVSREGLLNNYPVEPEMYYEVPGDLRQKEEQREASRAEELAEINETDEKGKLSMTHDQRGKGTGLF
jgi:hypothetical protein